MPRADIKADALHGAQAGMRRCFVIFIDNQRAVGVAAPVDSRSAANVCRANVRQRQRQVPWKWKNPKSIVSGAEFREERQMAMPWEGVAEDADGINANSRKIPAEERLATL